MRTYHLAIIRTSRDEAIQEVKADSLEEAKKIVWKMVVDGKLTFSQKQKPGYEMEEIND